MPNLTVLKNSPLAKWYTDKLSRTPAAVERLAREKGFSLVPTLAVNCDEFYVMRDGQIVRKGDLSILEWFLQRQFAA